MEVDELETQVCNFQRLPSNGWPSSRIVRVSRATGGKDRHSKVLTSKGLRDRRVRLSVATAIQFYDLQDRLGYDQPSKAVEWLLRAAASSIDELPSLDPSFSGHLEEKSKSPAGSSTSETSKGSGLSLARSENRVRARERAREMAANKEKEKEKERLSENSSFTDLLTGGISSAAVGRTATPMDYFQRPQFSFLQEGFVPAVTPAGGGESYSLNFSGAGAGLARGTLQSNLQSSVLPIHRFQDGSTATSLPFFIVPNGVVSDHFPATVGYGAGGRRSDLLKEKANN